jgi:D-sedoheptulose 7-phosphate isomerase
VVELVVNDQEISASMVVTSYLHSLHVAMVAIPTSTVEAAVTSLRQARARDATVVFVGNGGSASTASHFAADLAKNTQHPTFGRFRTICLSDNVALFSAWANDEGYENVFLEGVKTHLRPGDVLIAISGSGNSENVLRAAVYARNLGCEVIGLIGFSGGALRALCSIPIVVSAASIEEAEDGHLIVNHAFCTAIKALDAAGVQPTHTSSNREADRTPSVDIVAS